MTRRRRSGFPVPMIDTFDPALFVPVRHRARRRRHSGYYWAAWTLILWTVGAIATMLSPAVSGLMFGPLMVTGLVLFLAGLVTLIMTWRRVP